MNKNAKRILGLLTFLPLLLMAAYIFIMFDMAFTSLSLEPDNLPEGNPGLVIAKIGPLIIVALLLGLLGLGLLIFYLVHAIQNKQIDSTERVVWVLTFIFAGVVGMPVYWFMRIWQDPTGRAAEI